MKLGFRFLLVSTALVATLHMGAAPASGVVPHTGYGFGIADDDGDWTNPSNTPSLGEGFKLLRPKVFRLQILWNAFERGKWEQTRWIERTHKMIDKAKEQGVQVIILTIRGNQHDDVGSAGYFPTADEYTTQVRKIVQAFASKVDVWGPANEPNIWRTPGGGVTAAPVAASLLVQWVARMQTLINTYDASALMTSPDFLDGTSGGTWTNYVQSYKNAGGAWGNAAAFHPYEGVRSKSASTLNAYASIVPTQVPIWLTEVGSHHEGDSASQNSRLNWMIYGEPNNSGLATHPRVTRINYYHMRSGGASHDSALLNNNFTARPVWTTWCAASHNSATHPDCVDNPDGVGTSYAYSMIRGDGSVWLRSGSQSGQWRMFLDPSFNARQVEVDGNRLFAVAGDGSLFLREGLPGGGWQLLLDSSANVRQIDVDGNRLVAIAGDGSVLTKEGIPGGLWHTHLDSSFNAREVDLDGSRLVAVAGDRSIFLKHGLPSGTWYMLMDPSFNTRQMAFDGDRVVAIAGDGSIFAKNGLPGGSWQLLLDSSFNGGQVRLDGNRMLAVAGDKSVFLRDGLPGGSWQMLLDPTFNTRHVELGGNRMLAVAGDGSVFLRDGLPGGSWQMIAGSEFDARVADM